MSVQHLYLVAVAAVCGCATSAAPGTQATPRRASFLTAEEIAAAHADVNTAYDAVARLRPNWLMAHGAMSSDPEATKYASVFLNGQLYGGISSLKNIPAYYVADMRYYDVTQAGGTFGVQAGAGGAIEVRTKTP